MCIATVYYDQKESNDFVVQDVVAIDISNNTISCVTILGEKILLEAKIKRIDFLKHSVLIESIVK
jgi:predicted RNA-binding protein